MPDPRSGLSNDFCVLSIVNSFLRFYSPSVPGICFPLRADFFAGEGVLGFLSLIIIFLSVSRAVRPRGGFCEIYPAFFRGRARRWTYNFRSDLINEKKSRKKSYFERKKC